MDPRSNRPQLVRVEPCRLHSLLWFFVSTRSNESGVFRAFFFFFDVLCLLFWNGGQEGLRHVGYLHLLIGDNGRTKSRRDHHQQFIGRLLASIGSGIAVPESGFRPVLSRGSVLRSRDCRSARQWRNSRHLSKSPPSRRARRDRRNQEALQRDRVRIIKRAYFRMNLQVNGAARVTVGVKPSCTPNFLNCTVTTGETAPPVVVAVAWEREIHRRPGSSPRYLRSRSDSARPGSATDSFLARREWSRQCSGRGGRQNIQ